MIAGLPDLPPFTLRARVITPLMAGGLLDLPDALVEVDAAGRVARVSAVEDGAAAAATGVHDLRPMLVLPGLVDLHVHLPQLPNAGIGAGLDLLSWLERYIFPLERAFDADAARALAPAAFRAFAAAGTTTVVGYGAIWADSLEVCFEAAEAHGIRAVIGKVMMDRNSYDPTPGRSPPQILRLSLTQSVALAERWHGRDDGRLAYAFTPRFAVSCSDDILHASARRAIEMGAFWQSHLAEDRHEIEEVARLFPGALDYTDVYDRAGALGPRSILAHAIHLSDREIACLAESGAGIAHCPSSNLFLASGAMPLARYLEAGLHVGLGSDVAAGPDVSIFGEMRSGAYTQQLLRAAGQVDGPTLSPGEWLRLGTLGAAEVLGWQREIGSVEAGKQADLIVVDPERTALLPGLSSAPDGSHGADAEAVLSRLIFRTHPEMVRAAYVRGRRLPA